MIVPRSSAISVHYDLRPAKQAERRIFLQIFLSAAHLQFPISDSRYVGMGGFKYYDFITLHRYLNINRMISIEHDSLLIPRCTFNKPFGFITLFEGAAGQFISTDDFAGPNIVWLDYDQGISEDVLQDLIDLGSKLQPNSFLIVSVRAEPGGPYKRGNATDRLRQLREQVGEFVGDFGIEDMSDHNFRRVSATLLRRFVTHSFASRSGAKLYPVAQLQYRDQAYMATFAAAFCAPEIGVALQARLEADMPFLGACSDESYYSVRNFNLTEIERRIFDNAATSDGPPSAMHEQISGLGFEDEDLASYRDLMRYLPRYFEAFL